MPAGHPPRQDDFDGAALTDWTQFLDTADGIRSARVRAGAPQLTGTRRYVAMAFLVDPEGMWCAVGGGEVAQGAVGAAGTTFLQLTVEDRQIRAALGNPLFQVGPVAVEFADPVLPLAVQHRLRAGARAYFRTVFRPSPSRRATSRRLIPCSTWARTAAWVSRSRSRNFPAG
ncbi:hypothetical protein CRV15_28895 (plasmid) [Streptomyces clavuligerus]|nr:hypothetical protein CRV15_28895 [Streptomyces clavuligerus]